MGEKIVRLSQSFLGAITLHQCLSDKLPIFTSGESHAVLEEDTLEGLFSPSELTSAQFTVA